MPKMPICKGKHHGPAISFASNSLASNLFWGFIFGSSHEKSEVLPKFCFKKAMPPSCFNLSTCWTCHRGSFDVQVQNMLLFRNLTGGLLFCGIFLTGAGVWPALKFQRPSTGRPKNCRAQTKDGKVQPNLTNLDHGSSFLSQFHARNRFCRASSRSVLGSKAPHPALLVLTLAM